MPTPDTLRAAVEAIVNERPSYQRTMNRLTAALVADRAALAASPAPTDTPDERRPAAMPPSHGEWLPDARTYEDGATEQQRRTEVRATTCRRLGHHWTPSGVCDRCGDPRPTADAAPPEDEQRRDLTEALLRQYRNVVTLHEQVVMDTPEDRDLHDRAVRGFRAFGDLIAPRLAAAAPAVERVTPDPAWHHLADQLEHTANQPHVDTSLGDGYRAGLQEAADAIREQADTTRATPDPDTLAEALFEISMRLQGVIHGGWGSLTSEQHRFWHEQARPILIAAGVTLNQPAPGA